MGFALFLSIILWSVVFYFYSPDVKRSWRWSLALSCIGLSAYSLLLTEFCSAFDLLRFWPILGFWVIATLFPAYLLWRHRESIQPHKELQRLRDKLRTIPLWALVLLTIAFSLILVMAVVTPPMNFDVQIYHLPRQIYWLMQGSVRPFITHYPNQISMPVLSEFLGLNLLILSGGDEWHNLVQTLFLIASCGVVTLIVQAVGGSPRAKALSLLFVVLVPVLFLEASNAKNDVTLSFFILLPLLIGVNLWTGRWKASISLLLIAALSAGLAFATKGTALAYLIAPALLIIAACIHHKAMRVLLMASLPGIILIVFPVAPQLLRNKEVYGSSTGPNSKLFNLHHDPLTLISVGIRNSAAQFTCDSESWNRHLEDGTRSILSIAGLNAEDPANTYEGQNFHLPYCAGLEDIVPAPVQTGLILLMPFFLLLPSFRKSEGVVPLIVTTYLSLFLFCFIFRWQPWQGRLLIPGYLMAAPLAGIALDLLRPQWISWLVIIPELLALTPHLMDAGQRPLLGEASIFRMSKSDQMSRMMPGRAEDIQKLTAYLKEHPKIHRIMVDGGGTAIYGLLREIRVERPDVMIGSGHFDQPAKVDAVISTTTPFAGVTPPPINPKPPSPPGFQLTWNGSYYRVFVPVSSCSSLPASDDK
jgi:hypothetical protein